MVVHFFVFRPRRHYIVINSFVDVTSNSWLSSVLSLALSHVSRFLIVRLRRISYSVVAVAVLVVSVVFVATVLVVITQFLIP